MTASRAGGPAPGRSGPPGRYGCEEGDRWKEPNGRAYACLGRRLVLPTLLVLLFETRKWDRALMDRWVSG